MTKSAYLILVVVSGFLLEALFQLNVYIIILIMTLIFAYFWYIWDVKVSLEVQREYHELEAKVQSTSKDAHLKFKQLMSMVSSIPFPILLLDQKGAIVLHNDIDMILQKHIQKENPTYLRNDYVHKVQEFIKDSFILEKSFTRVLVIHNVEYQALSVPITTHGKFSGCLILFQDISKALEGEKMQKQFLADASHELKTPIAIMKGMVEILNREDFHDDETKRDFMIQIGQEINRLDLIVKDILVLSKMSTSQPILDRHKIYLREVMESCVTSLSKSAQEKGLSFSCRYEYKGDVFCDPMRMRQVITNLLSNAIKYSDGGSIDIALYEEDHHVVFEVKDHGCGLRSEQLEKIFDRFYRVNDDRARKSGGSGLGLAIVKSIVDAHAGHIEVESKEGEGTTFRVYLKN